MWSLLMTLQFPQLCAACHAALQFSFSNETESKIVMLVEFVFSIFLPGMFRRLRTASSFLAGQKGTKEPPGGGLRWALRAHIPPSPGPHFTGAPIRLPRQPSQRRGRLS